MLPLEHIIHSHDVSFHCYTDDTQIYLPVRSSDPRLWDNLPCVSSFKSLLKTHLYPNFAWVLISFELSFFFALNRCIVLVWGTEAATPCSFGMWATGLGGEERAGDGGFLYTKIFSLFKRGNLWYQPHTGAPKINKHKSQRQTDAKCYI